MCFDFFHNIFWNISHFKKKWARYGKEIDIGLHVKYPLFLSDFKITLEFSWQVYENSSNIKFYENPLVRAELFDADGRTNRHDEANSPFSQFCERA